MQQILYLMIRKQIYVLPIRRLVCTNLPKGLRWPVGTTLFCDGVIIGGKTTFIDISFGNPTLPSKTFNTDKHTRR